MVCKICFFLSTNTWYTKVKKDKGTDYVIGWKLKEIYTSKLTPLYTAFFHSIKLSRYSTVSANVMNTASINFHNKNVSRIWNGLLYFEHGFISGYITIYNCYYLLSLCIAKVKTEKYWPTNIIKMKNDKFKKFLLKIVLVDVTNF